MTLDTARLEVTTPVKRYTSILAPIHRMCVRSRDDLADQLP